jgi:hypothetical protein
MPKVCPVGVVKNSEAFSGQTLSIESVVEITFVTGIPAETG